MTETWSLQAESPFRLDLALWLVERHFGVDADAIRAARHCSEHPKEDPLRVREQRNPIVLAVLKRRLSFRYGLLLE
jgi:hypothetical protein